VNINRREAIIRMAVLLGGSLVGPRLFSAALDENVPVADYGFSAAEIALLDELGDTIIPETDTPGAKAVQIGAFIAMMVHDCYLREEQAGFKSGLDQLASDYRTRHGHKFETGPAATRTAYLNEFDLAHKKDRQSPEPSLVAFRMIKDLTVLGYFTSEIGATQVARHTEMPGFYQGDAPYKKGDKVWATS
jgi:hypothetical protein